MAIAYSAITSASTGPSAADLTLTINKPAGVAVGDLLEAVIGAGGDTANMTVTPPAGWTLVNRNNRSTVIVHLTYQRVADATDADAGTTSYAWRFVMATGTSKQVGAIALYTGVDTTTPVEASGTNNGFASTFTHPDVTTLTANTLVQRTNAYADAAAHTPPTGYAERADLATSGGGTFATVLLADLAQAAAGATGTITSTPSTGTNESYASQTMALKEGSSGTTYTSTVTGTTTSSGASTKQTGRGVSGALASAGAFVKTTARAVAGTVTSAGTLATLRAVEKILSGTLTSAGTLARQTDRALTASLTTSGTLIKRLARGLSGLLTSAGSLLRTLGTSSGVAPPSRTLRVGAESRTVSVGAETRRVHVGAERRRRGA